MNSSKISQKQDSCYDFWFNFGLKECCVQNATFEMKENGN